MSVQFVYGRPGTAMNRYLDLQAAAPAKEDPTAPIYVVTPRQYTYGTQAEISETGELSGHMGLQVTSPEGIAKDVLVNVYGGALDYVDLAGMSMLIRRILDHRRDELRAFRSISSDSALPSQLAKQLSALKRMDIGPQELQGYAAAHPDKLRIQDLSLIYGDLAEDMEERIDAEDMVNLAIEHLEDAWFLDDALVILRGFDEWSMQQIRFAEAVIAKAARVVVELPRVEEGEPDYPMYAASRAAAKRLQPAAERRGLEFFTVAEEEDVPQDIRRVARQLFSYDRRGKTEFRHMSIERYDDAEAEIRSVAAEIVRLHTQEGMDFEDMAVVWGETGEYEPLVRRIFSEAHIPYFTGEKKTLADSNLAEFVLTAAELTKGQLSKNALLAHVATGFTNLTDTERSVLTNYAFSYVSWGSQFRKKFELPQSRKRGGRFHDSIDVAERAREKLMAPILEELRPGEWKTTGETLEALEKYFRRMLTGDKISRKAERMETAYEQVSFMEQSAKTILTIISRATELLGDLPIEMHDLRRVLRAGFEAVRLSLVPAALDEVQAGPIMRTFVRRVKALFVVGVNDEVLPRFNEPMNDILSPMEWNSLVEALHGYTMQSSAEAQKFRIQRVMYQVEGHLYWSCQEGGKVKPSVLVQYLEDLRREAPASEKHSVLLLKQNAYDWVVQQIRQAADGGPPPDPRLAASVLFDPEFQQRTNQLRENLTLPNMALRAAPAMPHRNFSATRLQTMGACPYKHFLSYQLGAEEPLSTDVDHRTTGDFMHGVLQGVIDQTRGRGKRRWSDYTAEEFSSILEENIARESEEQLGEEPAARSVARIGALRPRILEAGQMMRAQQSEGLLTPVLAETHFSLENVLEAGQGTLNGFIDRVDMIELAGRRFFSVVDYKSSFHDFNPAAFLQGTDLQLIVYLLALEEMIRTGLAVPQGEGQFRFDPKDIIAGAGFFNLAPGLGSSAPANLPAAYGMRGLLSVPSDLAQQLYGSASNSLVSFHERISKDGSYHGSDTWRVFTGQKALGRNHELEALLRCGRSIIGGAVEKAVTGHNTISPARLSSDILACSYCPYRSICRFDEAEMGRSIRPLPTGHAKDLRQQILEEYGD